MEGFYRAGGPEATAADRRANARVSARAIRHAVGPPRYRGAVPRSRTSAEPRVTTAVRLPASLHDRLHREAVQRDVSANLLVTRAIEAYLDHLPPVDEVAP
jgi:predicted HicB family RNase H-like nuclease